MTEIGWTKEEYTPAVGRLHARILDLEDAVDAAYAIAFNDLRDSGGYGPLWSIESILRSVKRDR